MRGQMNDYSKCILYLKECHGYTEDDLSNLLEVPLEVVKFFINPERVNNFNVLIAVLKKEGFLYK